MTTLTRSSGIILHPTSLPGPDGIGDLGPEAYRWVDFLHQCGCSIWQVLPIGPTGYGDSPYQCFSAFAGNPFLISPTLLLDAGLLTPQDLAQRPEFPSDHVDYGPVIGWKLSLLDKAFERFNHRPRKKMTEDFAQFERNQKSWLLDFATFMAIKESLGGIAWGEWPESLRLRDKAAIKDFSRAHAVICAGMPSANSCSMNNGPILNSMPTTKAFASWATCHYTLPMTARIVGHTPTFSVSTSRAS
jgi:4-alpha-glucanotransferase